MNVLLLTSCNRIQQVLLSLSINHEIIQDKFSVIIVDNSTIDISDPYEAQKLHDSDDPYNVVKYYNYCSNVQLLYDAQQYFPKIIDYRVIHSHPRLNKQRGDSTMVGLGIMQAALLQSHDSEDIYCLKLTGTSILKNDIMPAINAGLKSYDVMTWHRTNIGGYERSTRVFACKPKNLVGLIAEKGWMDWVDDNSGVFEQRFAKHINNSDIKVNYTENDDASVLLEGGMALQQSYGREWILKFIQENSINTNSSPYLQAFMNGGIW